MTSDNISNQIPTNLQNEFSSLEQKQNVLKTKIQRLEEKIIAPKPWQLLGEVSSKNRPENSLLKQFVEFDLKAAPPPLLNKEFKSEIESLLRTRILSDDFNDPILVQQIFEGLDKGDSEDSDSGVVEAFADERKSAQKAAEKRKRDLVEAKMRKAKKEGKFVENKNNENSVKDAKNIDLPTKKSDRGLAEIYEEDFLAESRDKNGENVPLNNTQKEALKMFASIRYSLDALSNFHFTPKPRGKEWKLKPSAVPAVLLENQTPFTAEDKSLIDFDEIPTKTLKISAKNAAKTAIGAAEIRDEAKKARRVRKRKAKSEGKIE